MKTKQQILRKYKSVLGQLIRKSHSDRQYNLLQEKADTLRWVLELSDREIEKIVNEL